MHIYLFNHLHSKACLNSHPADIPGFTIFIGKLVGISYTTQLHRATRASPIFSHISIGGPGCGHHEFQHWPGGCYPRSGRCRQHGQAGMLPYPASFPCACFWASSLSRRRANWALSLSSDLDERKRCCIMRPPPMGTSHPAKQTTDSFCLRCL